MKKFKVAILLAAVFGVLLYYTLKYERGPDGDDGKKGGRTFYVLKISPEKVNRISISGKNQLIELERRRGGWQVVKPFSARASAESVNAILSAMNGLTSTRKMKASRKAMKEYGLSDPEFKVEVSLADAEKQLLTIGGKSPVEESWYATSGKPNAVYLVPDYAVSPFMKTPEDFRDTSLAAPFYSDDVVSLELKQDAGSIVCVHNFVKAGKAYGAEPKKLMHAWYYEDNRARDCTQSAESLLTAVGTGQAVARVANWQQEPPGRGLVKRVSKITVSFKHGKPIELDTGVLKNGTFIVRNILRKETYQVDGSFVEEQNKFRMASLKLN